MPCWSNQPWRRDSNQTASDKPGAVQSNEFRFGARRRARLLMSNWCFSNKDSATTARTPPGRTSLAMVANRWTASMSRWHHGYGR